MDSTGQIDLTQLLTDDEIMKSVVDWLRRHHGRPAAAVAAALERLRVRGVFLNRECRVRYLRRVLLGEFFVRWAKQHADRRVKPTHPAIDSIDADEVRAFELAMIALGDERAFNKVMPRMVKQRSGKNASPDLGSAEEFTCHIAYRAAEFADVLLANFNTDRPGAPRAAVNYLETTAVSRYLHRAARERKHDPALPGYLQGRNRLSVRTRLAAKLVDMPMLFTLEEEKILRNRYGLKGSLSQRWKVKEVAMLLEYPSPAVLSRKLYRLRAWAKNWTPPPESVPLYLVSEESDHE